VICDIDIGRTEEKFRSFGPAKEEKPDSKEHRSLRFEKLVAAFETGKLSPQEFREIIKNHYRKILSDEEIDDAWNALLLNIPEERIRLLESVRKNYRIFLLSNTNKIHYHQYLKDLQGFGYPDFDHLFEKAYFSFRVGLRKPEPEVFRHVLAESGLVPGETLFIDDTLQHVETARITGIHSYHLKPGEKLPSLFTR
jgi:putative hydrolase of the HAD superfamily